MHKEGGPIYHYLDGREFFCTALADRYLVYVPVPSDKLILQTDASGIGVGGVLSVIREEEELPMHSTPDNSPRQKIIIQRQTWRD